MVPIGTMEGRFLNEGPLADSGARCRLTMPQGDASQGKPEAHEYSGAPQDALSRSG